MRCPSCQHQPPSGSSFCNRCGAPLVDVPAEGERRWLTVMFCDMVGSTEFSQRLDAEELQIVLNEYQNLCARLVRSFDGHVAQYLGDGLLVYFGYPRAHEDDAFRAVNAALGIFDALPALNDELSRRVPALAGRPIEVRVGIDSGQVLLSDMGRGDEAQRLALGGPLNIAARLEALANAGEIVISEATQHLVRGAFALVDLGPTPLKGVAEPVVAYRVEAPSGAEGRLARSGTAGLTPFVGREQELALALDRWEATRGGHGQTLLLSGEPGIGKSRLVAALRESISGDEHTWVVCRCTVYHENSAFHPIIQMLEETLHVDNTDDASVLRVKLDATLRGAGLPTEHVEPLVRLLLPPAQSAEDAARSDGESSRAAMLESLVECLFQLSATSPVVFVVEDLHWIDPSTLELLGKLVAHAADHRILLVFNFRPEFVVPWSPGPSLASIGLHPLTREQIGALCTSVAGGRALPAELLTEIVAKADGVPLFAEELTRAVLDGEWLEEHDGGMKLAGPLRDLAIPSTLQESLMARLDGVGPAKQLAQLCAVIGREVSHELLRLVANRPEAELRAGLDELLAADLLAGEGTSDQARYVFRHALIHDTAYDSLLRRERLELHGRIAEALEEHFPERCAARPEELAHHHERAGSYAPAVRAYRRAAVRAVERLAHNEAVGHLRTAIDLIGRLPDSAERDRDELELQIALGTSSMIVFGQGQAQVQQAYARARELSEKVGNRARLFEALWGLSRFHQGQGRPVESYEIAEQMLSLAQKEGDPSMLRWAHLALGQALFWRGFAGRALQELRRSIAFAGRADEASERIAFGQDPEMSARALLGPALSILGRLEEALECSSEACERSRNAADPISHAMTLCFTAVVHQMRGAPEATARFADVALAFASERDMPLFIGFARVMKAWALAGQPAGESSIEDLNRGLGELRGAGAALGGPYIIGLLADTQRRLGTASDALATVDSALALAAEQESHIYDAELLRLRAEILEELDPARTEESERLLRRAIALARELGALCFELRAALRLVRLLERRGAAASGLELVRAAVDAFEDGSQTPDLTAARELLRAAS